MFLDEKLLTRIMSEEKKKCTNCGRGIAAENYLTHSLHCSRHVIKCPKCQVTVNKDQLKEHDLQEHALEPCNLCGEHYERRKLAGHISACHKRLLTCEYCELQVTADALDSHVTYCGSRTVQCETCSKFIMYKDMAQHICEHPTLLPTQPDLPGAESHVVNDFAMDELSRMLRGTLIDQANQNQQQSLIEKCELCGESVHNVLLHYEMCPLLLADSYNVPVQFGEPASLREDGLDILPCEFCSDIFPFDQLLMHQVNCTKNPGLTPRVRTPVSSRLGQVHPRRGHVSQRPGRTGTLPTSSQSSTGLTRRSPGQSSASSRTPGGMETQFSTNRLANTRPSVSRPRAGSRPTAGSRSNAAPRGSGSRS